MVKRVRRAKQLNPNGNSISQMFDRKWLRMVMLVFIIESAALFIFASVPLPSQTQSLFLSNYQSTEATIQNFSYPESALYLFAHNLPIGSADMIPGAGVIVFSASSIATGLEVSAIGSQEGIPGALLVLFLYTGPHTWLELPAYAVGITAGIYMLVALIAGGARRELKRYIASWVVVATLLLAGAVTEAGEIKAGLINPLYLYLFWIPVLLVIAAIALIVTLKGNKGKR